MPDPVVPSLSPDWLLKLQVDVAVHNSKLETIEKKIDGFIMELKGSYATKEEMKKLDKDISSVRENIAWLVKIVVGVIVTALLGLILIKGGVNIPH